MLVLVLSAALVLALGAASALVSMLVALATACKLAGKLAHTSRERSEQERRLAYERLYRDVMLVDVPSWINDGARTREEAR